MPRKRFYYVLVSDSYWNFDKEGGRTGFYNKKLCLAGTQRSKSACLLSFCRLYYLFGDCLKQARNSFEFAL
jgi:hypothetical protein